MTDLWLGGAFLLLLALLILVFPLLKQARQSRAASINAQLLKHRLDELQQELRDGLLNERDLGQAQQELKMALLAEQPSSDKNSLNSVSSPSETETAPKTAISSVWIGATAALFLAVAFGIYYQVNEVQKLQHWQAAQQRLPELGAVVVNQGGAGLTGEDLQDFALGLRTRLQQSPDDALGWLLLGRMYLSAQQIENALLALEKALLLEPQRGGTIMSYSQALLYAGDTENAAKATRLMAELVQRQGGNQQSLSLLAVAATQAGEKDVAISSWQQLQTLLAADDPLQRTATEQLNLLQSGETKLQLQIEIADNLRSKASADAFLFVFAQAPDAAGPPVAVVKQKLSEFPVVTELSDANAMLPGHNLSSLDKAKIVARVSFDENVATAPGELQGELFLDVNIEQNQPITILIDRELM